MRDIKIYPDPVLRKLAEPVDLIDDEIRQLADEMLEAMVKEAGFGLAAPQVGVSKRLILADVKDQLHVVVNPEFVDMSEEKQVGPEGCLSIPGVEADVERSQRVVIQGLSLDGEAIQIEAEALLARVFQHEVDHLNGVLFIDHLGKTKRALVLKEFEKLQLENAQPAKNQAAS